MTHGITTCSRRARLIVRAILREEGTAATNPVETTQIAPTILKLLGLIPDELQAVKIEGTKPLF